MNILSRLDLSSFFYVSIFVWSGRQHSVVFLCVWPGMVPTQRQLSIVVSDWGSYLGSLFPPVWCGILFVYSFLEHCVASHSFLSSFFCQFTLNKDDEPKPRCTLVRFLQQRSWHLNHSEWGQYTSTLYAFINPAERKWNCTILWTRLYR